MKSKRLSWVDPITDYFDAAKLLNLLNIERSYHFSKSFETTTIDRILSDEDRHINMRDLPGFYFCSANLANQMKLLLEKGD